MGEGARGEAEEIINILCRQQDAGLEPVLVGFYGTQRYIQYGCGFSLIAAVSRGSGPDFGNSDERGCLKGETSGCGRDQRI